MTMPPPSQVPEAQWRCCKTHSASSVSHLFIPSYRLSSASLAHARDLHTPRLGVLRVPMSKVPAVVSKARRDTMYTAISTYAARTRVSISCVHSTEKPCEKSPP